MKTKLLGTLGVLSLSCAVASSAIVNLKANVGALQTAALTDNSGDPIPIAGGGDLALIFVDLNGNGVSDQLNAFAITVGEIVGGDLLIAASGATADSFGDINFNINGDVDNAPGVVTGLDVGDSYYAVYFPGGGDSQTIGSSYVSLTDAAWTVPGTGNAGSSGLSLPNVDITTGQVQLGSIVPEPSSALLIGLAGLAFLRRRR